MPNMANLTVKKADGTTDVTYTALVPSAGDKSPAVWKSLSAAAISAMQPELRVRTSSNGDFTARNGRIDFSYPFWGENPVTTQPFLFSGPFNAQTTWSRPVGAPDSAVKEAAYQYCNLLYQTLIKETLNTGYAPT